MHLRNIFRVLTLRFRRTGGCTSTKNSRGNVRLDMYEDTPRIMTRENDDEVRYIFERLALRALEISSTRAQTTNNHHLDR